MGNPGPSSENIWLSLRLENKHLQEIVMDYIQIALIKYLTSFSGLQHLRLTQASWYRSHAFHISTVSDSVRRFSPMDQKIHRIELNWTMVQSIFQLWLPKFGVILVASCLISKSFKTIQRLVEIGCNRLNGHVCYIAL